jgi:ferric-dicitrate binding protein FerR (iron transport regulator)
MKLSKFVVFAAASESKLAEQWAAIHKRTRAPARRRLTGVVLGSIGFAAGAALVFVLQRPGGASSALDGAVFGSKTGTATVDLRDGSHIEVEPRARLAVLRGDPRAVRVELRGGAALFEVPHVDGRSFVVTVAGVEMSVVGSRFRVSMDAESGRVRVAVERGAVEVRRRGVREALQRLGADEEATLVADTAARVTSDDPIVRETLAAPAPNGAVPNGRAGDGEARRP